tara:strand:- start:1451 stop:1738 length:288 start_codon:yes stop_codon:yes gene_type:complete
MKKNNQMIDGLSSETWLEIEKISKKYPKEIRFAQGTQAKIAMLRFYLDPLLPDLNPPMFAMDQGRMLTIAYQVYKECEGEVVKELSLKIINKIIN